jgi:hypothetical protein
MTTELWRLSWLVVVLEQSEESCVVFAEDRSSAWLLIYTGGDGMDGRGPGCLWLGWTEEGDEGKRGNPRRSRAHARRGWGRASQAVNSAGTPTPGSRPRVRVFVWGRPLGRGCTYSYCCTLRHCYVCACCFPRCGWDNLFVHLFIYYLFWEEGRMEWIGLDLGVTFSLASRCRGVGESEH